MEWFRIETPFPREMGLQRILCVDYDQFDTYIRRLAKVDVYSSLFSIRQLFDNMIDCFLIDIDGSIRSSYFKMQNVLNHIITKMDIIPRIYFSGQGYHIYIDTEPLHVDAWRKLNRELVWTLGVESLVDMALVSNPRAMARYPGTMNSKTGYWMVRVDPCDTWDQIIQHARAMKHRVVEADKISTTRLQAFIDTYKPPIPERVIISAIDRKSSGRPILSSSGIYPPCVKNLIDEIAVSGEMDHERRVFLASVLLQRENVDDVMKYFSHASDYRESRTRYQLEHIGNTGYVPTKCEVVMGWGVCPGSCEYYPAIGRKLCGNK